MGDREMRAIIGALAVLVILATLPIQITWVKNANGLFFVEVTKSNGHKPISEGIIVVTYGFPPEGINLLYKYIDKTSGTHGTDQVNLTGSQNGEIHFIGFSSTH